MRLLVVFLYLGLLTLMTCTASVTALIHNLEIKFIMTEDPDFLSFFEYRFNYTERYYIVQKFGHFVSFFLLAAMLMVFFTSFRCTMAVSLTAAFFTEFAQLFFSRTGCLVDMIYDLMGAGTFLILHLIWSVLNSHFNGRKINTINREVR
ncbi:hypothetical protein FZC78_08055 [Rossellomorea vietnamensis]|uniref:VanZ-like domain-containing protein n=1 Tax=Rossellomorea vietnamensis TaxID=218284 RepID=A0A5D4NWH7_9BACI|nr:VanZ family protein [Rossellomorea vietnamensis]TYS17798.1 hypothetical protein FZC78_08055 [Rossellomorea vietnamensis]